MMAMATGIAIAAGCVARPFVLAAPIGGTATKIASIRLKLRDLGEGCPSVALFFAHPPSSGSRSRGRTGLRSLSCNIYLVIGGGLLRLATVQLGDVSFKARYAAV